METITDSVKMYFSINIIDCDEHNKANCKNENNGHVEVERCENSITADRT